MVKASSTNLEDEIVEKIFPHVARRLADVLLAGGLGQKLGIPDTLPNGLALPVPREKIGKKRHMSASARKRIADAQRRRWAKVNQEKEREAKRVKGSPAYEGQRAIKKGRR